jgi:hypothetical protein
VGSNELPTRLNHKAAAGNRCGFSCSGWLSGRFHADVLAVNIDPDL